MAQHDLTTKIGHYLDRHMVAPLLEFTLGKEVRIGNICLMKCVGIGTGRHWWMQQFIPVASMRYNPAINIAICNAQCHRSIPMKT